MIQAVLTSLLLGHGVPAASTGSGTGYLFGSSMAFDGHGPKPDTQLFLVGDLESPPSPKHETASHETNGSGSVWLIERGGEGLPRQLLPRSEEEGFGSSLLGGLDLDADSIPDFIVGSSGYSSPLLLDAAPRGGALTAYSGKSLEPMYTIPLGRMSAADASFGLLVGPQLLTCGDQDKDGRQDIVVAYLELAAGNEKRIHLSLLSGRTGKALWERTDLRRQGASAVSCCVVADVDKDSQADIALAVVCPDRILPPGDRSQAARDEDKQSLMLISGHTGATIRYLVPPADAGRLFGVSLQCLDDHGDGGVLALGNPDTARPAVYLVPLLETGQLAILSASTPQSNWGMAIAVLNDLDGDSRKDLLVSAPEASPQSPTCWAVSGKDGRKLRSNSGNLLPSDDDAVAKALGGMEWDGEAKFGAHLLAIPDVDGDGVGDYMCSACSPACFACVGTVGVFSGRTGKRIELYYKAALAQAISKGAPTSGR
jgi:hypothetical protein